MQISLMLNNRASILANYVGWAPSPCEVRLTDTDGATEPVSVTLRNQRTDGGQVVFYTHADGAFREEGDTLAVRLPLDGSPLTCYVGGKWDHVNPRYSSADRDTAIEGIGEDGASLGSIQLMVRIRKNVEKLTPQERDRFLQAFSTLNNQGQGSFSFFRDMHRDSGYYEAHADRGFLPWHRAYLLDLERELQKIDSSVALPYWRFDEPTTHLFTQDFMGEQGPGDQVRFRAGHPFENWITDNGRLGILRGLDFDPSDPLGAHDESTPPRYVFSQEDTFSRRNTFATFAGMEGNPHGLAHLSFSRDIENTGTAPMDPLFFLLHANVDRLWAMWQYRLWRFDETLEVNFSDSPNNRAGHRRNDTMWPWNQVRGNGGRDDRPRDAPGGRLSDSQVVVAPGEQPVVGQMLDYAGVLNQDARLGFDYDDVPFISAPVV